MTAREYMELLPFSSDRFQADAAGAIDRGETVVVTAPTGSGKTVVAEAAMARALGRGRRAIYTTPLKALSNQKYGDLCRQHGTATVGLLTGDNSINASAPIVVMTTEVLRNMMYAHSPELDGVGVVVLDEVHYLADPARGPVWEEIIIHLDRSIPLVCLSATVANAEEFADWVRSRRGPTSLVVEKKRAVPLDSEYLLSDRWERGALRMLPAFDKGRPNERIVRMLHRGRGHRYGAPRRVETCEFLHRRGLLPAIYFIFSRAGCDAAAQHVVDAGLRLATPEEAQAIDRVAKERTAHLSVDDLAVLGYGHWLAGLEAGVATHHAGLVPAFKETTERLFAAGLVKLVFATETLSLGINMPARAVVLENLSKYTGQGHALMSGGDYTQLTGRAGRRGIDMLGTAVVLHTPYLPFERVAAIAASGPFPLRSVFVPRYNMVANLIASYSRARAEELLNASFARFQDERSAEQSAASMAEEQAALAADREAAECELGDVWAIAESGLEDRSRVMSRFVSEAEPGDVLEWGHGVGQRYVVMASGRGRRPRLLTLTADGRLHRIASDDLPVTAVVLGHLGIPMPPEPRQPGYRDRVAALLAAWSPGDAIPRRPLERGAGQGNGAAACPRLERHLEAVRSIRRRERRIEGLGRRQAAVSEGMVPRLNSVLRILGNRGYAEGWALTAAGRRLRFIYNELDLLLAESLGKGLFEGLATAEVAALVSIFTYEPRAEADSRRLPTSSLERCVGMVTDTWERLAADEEEAGLEVSRPPEVGFADIAYRWAKGSELRELFEEGTSGVGDFVRNCRQLIDLMLQIAEVVPGLERPMRSAVASVDRGVVAAAGAI